MIGRGGAPPKPGLSGFPKIVLVLVLGLLAVKKSRNRGRRTTTRTIKTQNFLIVLVVVVVLGLLAVKKEEIDDEHDHDDDWAQGARMRIAGRGYKAIRAHPQHAKAVVRYVFSQFIPTDNCKALAVLDAMISSLPKDEIAGVIAVGIGSLSATVDPAKGQSALLALSELITVRAIADNAGGERGGGPGAARTPSRWPRRRHQSSELLEHHRGGEFAAVG